MKIEILYPEIANLFGDMANIKYIMASLPDCKIIGTDLNTKPAFLESKDIDLVYMGTMTENSQLIAMDHLEPYKDEIKRAIETGQRFLMTGNAFEIFCKDITDLDDMPINRFPERVDAETKTTRCLGIFDINVKGPGLDKTSMGEGIKYKNFMATYLTGPLLVLNPKLMIRLLLECGETRIDPPHFAAAMAAYEQRLEEFRRDKLNYTL